jgi:hypothetical protein
VLGKINIPNGDLALINANVQLTGSFSQVILPVGFPNAYVVVIEDERLVLRVGPAPESAGLSGGAVAAIVLV